MSSVGAGGISIEQFATPLSYLQPTASHKTGSIQAEPAIGFIRGLRNGYRRETTSITRRNGLSVEIRGETQFSWVLHDECSIADLLTIHPREAVDWVHKFAASVPN